MTDWIDTLYAELDAWNFDGVAAGFWWRDDDAQAASERVGFVAGFGGEI